MSQQSSNPFVAIACGGTGGHLFPGLSVAEELLRQDCDVMLLISPKEVDQQAVKNLRGLQIETLPAVGLSGNLVGFVRGFGKSYQKARRLFAKRKPQMVLAMGGFTSAPPILAGKMAGAKTFLHESNSIPGRANRWLSHFVDAGFVYFPKAQDKMHVARCEFVGMPVRAPFLESIDAISAKISLGLDPKRPVLLIMGGSQGASGVNQLATAALPAILRALPDLQFFHLTGASEFARVQAAYEAQKCRALVRPFFTEMELALAAATLAISRSGASSLAEIAAMRVPSILVPYPTAADNHQYFNAKAFVECDAARMVPQIGTSPETFAEHVIDLLKHEQKRGFMKQNLGRWHFPTAAQKISDQMLASIGIQARSFAEMEQFPQARMASVMSATGSKNVFASIGALRDPGKGANV